MWEENQQSDGSQKPSEKNISRRRTWLVGPTILHLMTPQIFSSPSWGEAWEILGSTANTVPPPQGFCLFFFFFFFWCGPFSLFLSFYWIYYNIASVFYVLFFWPWGMWDLSSPTRDRTHTPCIGRQSFNHWTTREVPGTLSLVIRSILTKTGA